MTFEDNLKESFLERFEGIGEDDYEQPQYWQDDIFELADQSVPIYTDSMYELWMELGRPEVDDEGLIEGVTDIDKIVGVALYCYASNFLYQLAHEHGLD
jgi:hypothetical protein